MNAERSSQNKVTSVDQKYKYFITKTIPEVEQVVC